MRNILFRADSSSTIGTGHIMRDLVLARQFPTSKIVFATQMLEGNINHKIEEQNYSIEILNSNHLNELIEVIDKLQIDMIIIDHYGINYEDEKQLKERTGITVMVLDDTYERHYCDILLNHNIYAKPDRYQGLVPAHCELQCGEAYTLIRDEFKIAKANKKPLLVKPINILVAMGGSDPTSYNISILEVLNQFQDIHIDIVTTTSNPNLEALKAYIRGKEKITLHINSTEMAKLMAQSHISVLAPSVTLNEAYFMELLFIPIQTADNQKEMVAFLEVNEYPVLKEFDAERLYHTLQEFIWFYNAQHTH